MTKANDQHHELNIERARDLLSPYLDDEVTETERVLVEEAISTSAELRQELEQLRQTINLVTALPQIPAPRPFTLSEADVRGPEPETGGGGFGVPFWLRSWLPIAATLLCVVALGGFFLLQFSGLGGSASPQIAMESAPPATQPAPAAESAERAGEEEPAAAEDTSPEPFSQEAAAPPAPTQTPVEEVEAMEEAAAAEEAAPAEPPAEEPAADEAAAEEKAMMAAQEATEEEAETMNSAAIESAPAGQSPQADEVSRNGEGLNSGGGVAITATPAPASTPAPLPAATGEAQAAAAAEATEETLLTEEATAAEEATPPQGLSESDQADHLEKAEPADQVATGRPEVRQTATSTPPSLPPETQFPQSTPTGLILTGIGVLAGLVVIGLVVWLIVRKQKS